VAALSQMISLAVRGYIIAGGIALGKMGKREEGAIVWADVMRDIF